MLYCNLREAYDTGQKGNFGHSESMENQEHEMQNNQIVNRAQLNVPINHVLQNKEVQGCQYAPIPQVQMPVFGDEEHAPIGGSPELLQLSIPRKKQKSHPYYIKKFLNSFTDDDIMSLASNYDTDMYNHIASCKYCRTKINYGMKKRFLDELASNKYNNVTGYSPANYQIQHFNPNVNSYANQQLQPQTQLADRQSIPQQITQNTQNKECKYDQYFMMILIFILVLFLLADITIKIIK